MSITPLQIASRIFWLLTATELMANQFGIHWLHSLSKPLLMPLLMAMLLYSVMAGSKKKWIMIGLGFAWLGDVFLLLDYPGSFFFIAGLLSFLITHVFYIIYFLALKSAAPSLLKKRPFYILFTLCYGSALVGLLFPHLGELKMPVIVYATVICGMLLCSLHIYYKIQHPSNKFFIMGASLFVLSDSLLAVNKFYHSIPKEGIWIMLSYCAAQYLIVKGSILLTTIADKTSDAARS